jgi:hypothetical protein
MCYDASSSIRSFGLVTILSALLMYFGDNFDRFFAVVVFAVVQMQLAEYFMWNDQSCGKINQFATFYAYLAILLQPLSVLLGGYYFNIFNIPPEYILGFALLISVFWLTEFGQYVLNTGPVCSKPKNGHLLWDFLRKKEFNPSILLHVLYFIGFMGPLLFSKYRTKGFFFLGLLLTSFFIHYLQYKEQWHTMWCFSIRTGMLMYVAFTILHKIVLQKYPYFRKMGF